MLSEFCFGSNKRIIRPSRLYLPHRCLDLEKTNSPSKKSCRPLVGFRLGWGIGLHCISVLFPAVTSQSLILRAFAQGLKPLGYVVALFFGFIALVSFFRQSGGRTASRASTGRASTALNRHSRGAFQNLTG